MIVVMIAVDNGDDEHPAFSSCRQKLFAAATKLLMMTLDIEISSGPP